MRYYLTHGQFGLYIALGAAAALGQYHAGNPVGAAVLAVLGGIAALTVFLTVDRKQRS